MADSTTSSAETERWFDILILENDRDNLQMLAYLFEANLCVVRTAANLRDAEAALLQRAPDVVLSDLHLGGGEAGWVFAERMRGDPRTRHVARIAMTGETEPKLEVVRMFDAYVQKPFDIAAMLDLVRRLAAVSRAAA